MRLDRPPVAPADLFPRRLAVRALGVVLARYDLAEVAVKLSGDAPEQVLPGPTPGEVRLFADGWDRGQAPVAVVFLQDLEGEAPRARVVVERARELVRRAHRKDFREEDVGIQRVAGEPDLDVEVPLEDVLSEHGEAMRTRPQRAAPRPRRALVVRSYRGALGSGRRR